MLSPGVPVRRREASLEFELLKDSARDTSLHRSVVTEVSLY